MMTRDDVMRNAYCYEWLTAALQRELSGRVGSDIEGPGCKCGRAFFVSIFLL
jgi:hypothetical protein